MIPRYAASSSAVVMTTDEGGFLIAGLSIAAD
jgi:hypothetical protein